MPCSRTPRLRAEQQIGRLGRHVDTDAAATLLVGSCYEIVLPRLFRQDTDGLQDVETEFLASLIRSFLDGAQP